MAGHRVGHRRFHKRVNSRGSNGSSGTSTSPRGKTSVSVDELAQKALVAKKEKAARGSARAAEPTPDVVPVETCADVAEQRSPIANAMPETSIANGTARRNDATPDEEIWIGSGADQRAASSLFISSVAPVLEHLCEMTSDRGPTSFDGVKPPPIDLQQYIQRLYSYIPCSSQCFVYAIIYVDRILRVNPRFKLSNLNVHRTFFTALVVASKFYDDEYYSNAWYGRVGGVGTRELNILEVSFMKLIQFRLVVTPKEYEMYLKSVERACSTDSDDVAEAPPTAACGAASSVGTTCAASCEKSSSAPSDWAVECSTASSAGSCAASAA